MKKSIFLFFAAILCSVNAWAITFTGGYVYFDNTNTNWSGVFELVAHQYTTYDYIGCTTMNKIDGTNNLYYVEDPAGSNWGSIWGWRIMCNPSAWGSQGSSESNLTTWSTYCTASDNSGGLTSGYSYLCYGKSSEKNCDLIISSLGNSSTQYNSLNYIQTIEQQLTTDNGSSYSLSTLSIATVTVSSKMLNGRNSTTASNGTILAESSSATCSAARTATVTYSVSGVNSDYTFVGWYDGNTQKSTSSTYTYQATEAKTITARFAVATEESHEITISYKCGSTEIQSSIVEQVGVESAKEYTAPTITGYTFANWSLGAGVATEDELTANPISITTKSGETDYNLTANYNKIQLTYNVTVPAGSKGCYIAGDMNDWSFTEMTKVDDTHYTITIDGATAEHKYKYASSGEWKYVEVKEDGGDVDNRTYSENDVVAKWKAMPGVYLAGGMNDWNTTANEFVDGTLSIDLAASSTIEFKIVKDGDWLGNGEEIKADNCENVTIGTGGNNCKIATGVAGSYTFTWDNTNTQLSVTYPAGVAEDVYTIVGAATLVGSEWNTSDTNNDMEKQSDGSYKLVKEDVVLAVGTYDYKVIKNHSYDWSIPEGNSNQQLPISTSAKYDVTFVLSSDLTTLTATATFIESVDVTPDCYLSGNEALTGQDWGTHDELKMTYESSTETYSITLNNLAAATAFEMKVVYNGSWLGFDNLATTPDGVKNSGGNISFQLAAEGSLTVTYNVTNGITLTGNFYVPDYSNQPNIIYFHPSTEWKKDGARFAAYFFDAESKWISMTDNDGDGVYEVANEKKNEKVIFCSMTPDNLTNDWEQKIHQTQDLTIPNTADDPNICYAFWQNSLESNDGTWVAPTPLTADNYETIISTYGGKTVNIVVERQFADAEWHTICLPFTYAANWFGTAYQLGSLIANGVEGITITTKECTNIEAGKPYLLKPNKIEEYDHVILSDVQVPTSVSAGTNSVTGAGYTVTLTANLKTNGTTTTEYWIGNGGYLYNDAVSKLGLRSYFTIPPVSSGMPPRFRVVTGENEATGIEDIITTDTPVKVIENGQLIIIRNGEKFNVQGQKL